MAKKEKEGEEIDESIRVVSNLLRAKKEDHYNFEDTIYYKVPSSSLCMNSQMDGGINPGAHRFIGTPSGGKSSAALDYMKNFLELSKKGKFRGVFFDAESKLTPNMQKRSGIRFVRDEEEWENGTCLIVDSNTFEFVFDVVRDLIVSNKEKCKYFFILDSLDMMAKRDDLKKPFEEAATVASGPLLTSVFLKKVSIALTKRGHIALLISQVRDSIKINTYGPTATRQGSSNGGHAIEHAAGWVLDFLPRFQDDIIREGGEKNGETLGHYAKCKIVKADNESYLREIRYPICYGRSDGNSIWREKEILDILQMWNYLIRAGAWYHIEPGLAAEIKTAGFPLDDKYQGIKNVNNWLVENPEVIDFLAIKFQKQIEALQSKQP